MLSFIFKSMLLCSLVGTVLFGLLCVIRPLTEKRFSSLWHYITGLCVMLLMILPIRITLPQYAGQANFTHNFIEEKNDIIFDNSAISVDNDTENSKSTVFDAEMILQISACLWALCACSLVIGKEISYRLFLQKMKSGTESCDDYYHTSGRHLRIRKGSVVSSPMIVGIISPTLYLPDIELSENELDVIISHEIIHLLRKDLVAKRLIGFVRCVHFFNPVVHIMAKKVSLDCEISCDLAATEKMCDKEKKNYMMTILSLVSRSSGTIPSFAAGILQGKDILKRRFIKINNREKTGKKTKIISAVAAIGVLSSAIVVSGVFASGIEKPEPEPTEITTLEPTTGYASEKKESPVVSPETETVGEKAEEPAKESVPTTVATEVTQTAITDNKTDSQPAEIIVPTTVEITKTEKAETAAQEKDIKSVSGETEKSDNQSTDLNLIYPCDSKEVSGAFGKNGKRFHDGVDFRASIGSDVYAAADGKVQASGKDSDGTYGNMIIIVTSDGTKLIYGHLDSVSVHSGDTVKAGQAIAKSGATGMVTGPCLHFSVVRNGEYVDPMNYLG